MHQAASILYIPHGGGPLPLMDHEGHAALVSFLKQLHKEIPRPEAIVVISAHWERDIPVITANPYPKLIYDYFGFPERAYEITYPAKGAPDLAQKMLDCFSMARIKATLDSRRGFDHGLFIPLKLIYPDADIPCVQLSLTADLDPNAHLGIGKALAPLCRENLLILGSGFSFHNMAAFAMSERNTQADNEDNHLFQQWLIETCTDTSITQDARKERLIHWERAPHARYCHPREEHLLPLHVCAGMAQCKPGRIVFQDHIMGQEAVGIEW